VVVEFAAAEGRETPLVAVAEKESSQTCQ